MAVGALNLRHFVWQLGVGVEHDALVELAKECFSKKPSWAEDVSTKKPLKPRDVSLAQYTGGKHLVRCVNRRVIIFRYAVENISVLKVSF
jgi:hypothetical protein